MCSSENSLKVRSENSSTLAAAHAQQALQPAPFNGIDVGHDVPSVHRRHPRCPIVCASCRIRFPLNGVALTEEGVEEFDPIEEQIIVDHVLVVGVHLGNGTVVGYEAQPARDCGWWSIGSLDGLLPLKALDLKCRVAAQWLVGSRVEHDSMPTHRLSTPCLLPRFPGTRDLRPGLLGLLHRFQLELVRRPSSRIGMSVF